MILSPMLLSLAGNQLYELTGEGDAEAEAVAVVQKKSLPFSPIISDF